MPPRLRMRSKTRAAREPEVNAPSPEPRNVALVEPGTLVVVVDDDRELASSVSDFLTLEGYEVRPFATAETALAQIVSGLAPSLVVLDLWIPTMGAAEFLRRLRRFTPSTPVLLLSGAVPDSRARGPGRKRRAREARRVDLARSRRGQVDHVAQGQAASRPRCCSPTMKTRFFGDGPRGPAIRAIGRRSPAPGHLVWLQSVPAVRTTSIASATIAVAPRSGARWYVSDTSMSRAWSPARYVALTSRTAWRARRACLPPPRR